MKTLADRAQAYLADPWHSAVWRNIDLPPAVKRVVTPAFRTLRARLRGARRFTLDDTFVREAVLVASAQPEVMLKRLELALLPYDCIWLEWNQRVRVHEQAALGTMAEAPNLSKVPELGGFLVYRIGGNDPGHWVTHAFGDAADVPGEAAISSVSQTLNPAAAVPVHYQVLKDAPLLGKDKEVFAAGWGYRYNLGGDREAWAAAQDALFARGQTAPDFAWALPMVNDKGVGKGVLDLFMHEAKEQSGDLRFLVTVLAMINCVPVQYRHEEPKGRFTRRLNSMDYLDSHVVTIHAGRAKTVSILDKAVREHEASRKRAHEVRGFWRAEPSPQRRPCAHLPSEVNGRHAVCGVCKKGLVWVDHHVRGDASLGFVQKDYEVTR